MKWIPRNNGPLAGEVKGKCIFLYDEDIDTAFETLKHEFLDYAVSEVIEPYMRMTNRVITLLNERAYEQKESLIEDLMRVI
jgi:hypothetical protein